MPGIVSLLILLVTGILLVFWLRLTCQSILRQHFPVDYSGAVAEANQLHYLQVRRMLAEDAAVITDCKELVRVLEWDHKALAFLLRNAATLRVGQHSHTERLLTLDFRLLCLWVRLKRMLGARNLRAPLLEMVAILEYFGKVLGQRLVLFPALEAPAFGASGRTRRS